MSIVVVAVDVDESNGWVKPTGAGRYVLNQLRNVTAIDNPRIIAPIGDTEVAALWGSAENVGYDLTLRLWFALAALEKMSVLVPGWDA